MSRYIPEPSYPDMMPVDISFVFEDEKPAGKHGFIKADGDDLRFEDGTLARFWGVNFNGGACFPEHDYSPKDAKRLAEAGCNIVRFHQLDAEFDTPNIYAYTKGKRVSTTRVLDETSLDHLDYLIYCLKEQGIYCYLDMSTYRKFKEGDGVPDYEKLPDNARPWGISSPCLIELQKEFVEQIWNHYNPYTKLKYNEDPVFVLTEIVNESDLFTNSSGAKSDYVHATYYENEFREMFRDWLKENGKEYDWENCDLFVKDPEMIEFKIHITKKYFKEMHDAMRKAGCKIPITGSNWTHDSAHVKAHEDMDFTDTHHYFYTWKWGNTERVCEHRPITGVSSVFAAAAKMKLPEKPLFISEWDVPWPNSYRAEGPIYYAAVGALQGWAGFAIHTYSYGTRLELMNVLGREQSSPVGGVPYREGIFSVWNDPAKFGLFYHCALMLRRGDVSRAKKKVAVQTDKLEARVSTAFKGLLERSACSTIFDNKLPEGYDEMVNEADTIPTEDPNIIMSDTGELWRDLKKKFGVVDTPRTKIVYGTLARGGAASSTRKNTDTGISINGMTVNAYTDFGVIALSSLTDDPIEKSNNILISAIGRARNTGAQFDGDKMLELGTAPILAEVVSADIHLKIENGDKIKVWGVNAEGFYAGKCPTTYEDGILSFRIGDELNPACHYLIVAD